MHFHSAIKLYKVKLNVCTDLLMSMQSKFEVECQESSVHVPEYIRLLQDALLLFPCLVAGLPGNDPHTPSPVPIAGRMHVLTHSKYACLARRLTLKTGESRWELTEGRHLIKRPRGKGTITVCSFSINYLCWPLERQHFRLSLLSLSPRSRYRCSLPPVQSPRQLAPSWVQWVFWKLRCLLQWLYGSQALHKHYPRSRRKMRRSRLLNVGGIILPALQQDYRQSSDAKLFLFYHLCMNVSLTCAERSVYWQTCIWSQHALNAGTIVWPRDQIRDLITCALDKPLHPQSPFRR